MYERLYAMKYLFDTHLLIWYFDDFNKIPKKIREIIHNENNTKHISVFSIVEIVIKLSAKKLTLNISIDELYKLIKNSGFILIPIKQKHLTANLDLPLIHGDPFDRLLIATAISENMKFITSDKENQQYDVEWVWDK